MWITATRAMERTEAINIAQPKLEEIAGKKLDRNDLDEIYMMIRGDIQKYEEPLGVSLGGFTTADGNNVNWDGRAKRLSEVVPLLYQLALKRKETNKDYNA